MSFTSKEEFVKYWKDFYKSQGVILVLSNGKDSRFLLKCNRNGTFKSKASTDENVKNRSVTSRKTGCSFQIICHKTKKDNIWQIQRIEGEHNHDVTTNLSGHPEARKMTDDQIESMKSLYESNTAPRMMVSYLQSRYDNYETNSRDIYNLRIKFKTDMANKTTSIECLMNELSGPNYETAVELDGSKVRNIFFARKESVKLAS